MNQKLVDKAGEIISKDRLNCVLALIDADGYPTASTITVSKNDGNNWLTFCTGFGGIRTKSIDKCKRASVCFFSPDPLYNITLVGQIEVITDPEVKKEMWYDGLGNHFSGSEDTNYCVLKFKTERYKLMIGGEEAGVTVRYKNNGIWPCAIKLRGGNIMGELSKLINIGKEVERQLDDAGIATFDELKELGSRNAWLKIRQTDPSSCYNKLCALEGAIQGIRWHNLSPEIKGINTAGQALHPPPAAASAASRRVLNPSFPHSLDHTRASTVAISLRSSIKNDLKQFYKQWS
ncbi:MAG: TfoX/Sxy family DNA transformation protein [Spirochaetaceae bacterium]|nr:TfoX/Sxy family DNA transformation protein [Spirochaetaceae bacterium]